MLLNVHKRHLRNSKTFTLFLPVCRQKRFFLPSILKGLTSQLAQQVCVNCT